MNADDFDAVVRKIAARAEQRRTRRSLLGATIGSAAVAGGVLCGHPAAANQTARPVRRVPGGRTTGESAFDLDLDPGSIFAYVRDAVIYEPYTGALRGSTGTLWALAGNSADQALLIASLLREALVDVRLVAGPLEDAAAAALLETARLDRTGFENHLARMHAPVAPLPTGPLTDEIETILKNWRAEGERRANLARERWQRGVAQLEEALAGAGLVLPEPVFALPELERTRHVWVQYRDGTNWIDLDPSFPDASPGQMFAAVAETWDEMPDELWHTVTIRVRAERIAGDQLSEQTLLNTTLRSAELGGLSLTLTHVRPGGLTAFGLSLGGVLEDQLQYVPNLTIGSSQAIAGREPLTVLPEEGATDFLGERSREGDAVAEWIDFLVDSPGQAPILVTRTVFDRIPPAARATGTATVDQVDPPVLIDLGGEFGPAFLPLERVLSVVVSGGDLPISVLEQDYSVPDPGADLGLFGIGHQVGRGLFDTQLTTQGGYRVFADRPNVTGTWLAIEAIGTGDSAGRASSELDLIVQHFAAIPMAGGGGGGAHPLLAAGVASQTVERMQMEPTPEQAAAGAIWRPGAGALFEAAVADGIRIVVLAGSDPLAAVPDEARLRVQGWIERGMVVIAPEGWVELDGQPSFGYWVVDPGSGATFDEMVSGRGAEGIEYDVTMAVPGNAAAAFVRFGLCMRLKAVAINAIVCSSIGYAMIGGAAAGGADGINLLAAYSLGALIAGSTSGVAIGAGLGMMFAGGC